MPEYEKEMRRMARSCDFCEEEIISSLGFFLCEKLHWARGGQQIRNYLMQVKKVTSVSSCFFA